MCFDYQKVLKMEHKFIINGSKKIVLKPQNALEEALFNEVFGGEVKVEKNHATNEVTITKIEKNEMV